MRYCTSPQVYSNNFLLSNMVVPLRFNGTTSPDRSRIMQKVRSKNTRPEIIVRSLIHRLGYRFRIHYPSLPSKPDVVLPKKRKIIFVHGCFWHGHSCRAGQNRPKTHKAYWENKLSRTMIRDKNNVETLKKMGWRVLVIWECEIRDKEFLVKRITEFLEG